MAEHLSWNIFPLLNQANNNDADRPGSLLLEYWEAPITISTNEGTAEVPTSLDEVLFMVAAPVLAAASDPTDSAVILSDYVITTGAITVNVKSIDISDGALTVRGFFIGKKSPTVLINTPTE